MRDQNASRNLPGNSILGGSASGLSYEGALRDALGREEQERRLEAGRLQKVSSPRAAQPRPRPIDRTRGRQ